MSNEVRDGSQTERSVVFMQMKNGINANGLYVRNGVFVYEDDGRLIKSYPDTGVFVLFEGSQTVCTDEKFGDCIQNGRTTKTIVFQSRRAAARFVLGDSGDTNNWT